MVVVEDVSICLEDLYFCLELIILIFQLLASSMKVSNFLKE